MSFFCGSVFVQSVSLILCDVGGGGGGGGSHGGGEGSGGASLELDLPHVTTEHANAAHRFTGNLYQGSAGQHRASADNARVRRSVHVTA